MLEINKRTGIPGRTGKGCRSPTWIPYP